MWNANEPADGKKTVLQFLKFAVVSSLVTIIQLVLVNVLLYLMKGWKAPLPSFLNQLFTAEAVGEGNNNWGYVLPFFLSNAAANVYGYIQNKRTTFHSNASGKSFVVYAIVVSGLILFSTWMQGVIVHRLRMTSLAAFAATIAGLCAGWLQFAVLFPLEKFVLLKEKTEDSHAGSKCDCSSL